MWDVQYGEKNIEWTLSITSRKIETQLTVGSGDGCTN